MLTQKAIKKPKLRSIVAHRIDNLVLDKGQLFSSQKFPLTLLGQSSENDVLLESPYEICLYNVGFLRISKQSTSRTVIVEVQQHKARLCLDVLDRIDAQPIEQQITFA